MNKIRLISVFAPLLLSLAGCGGGGGGSSQPPPPPPPPPPPISTAEAFQFLNQASFGATEAEAEQLKVLRFEGWIDDQLEKPASLQLPYLQSLPRPQFLFQLQPDRVDIWFKNVLHGEDQLRQRVAFALSEIMVVSQLGSLGNATYSLAGYYDVLARNAFGNYRELIEEVTLHPAMGVYLSMLGNERPNPALNIRPDENYARELMQLFSIGLVELNIDGTVRLDNQGQPIPTYDQSIIEGFAHVFTGWNYAGAFSFEQAFRNDANQVVPMQLYPPYHDDGPKKLLNGVTLPAGQTGDQDLQAALDNVFNHPNVGPFIAIRLIQRLTTSNPSPGYVERVARVFNDNGFGERGDLGAVVKAILLDEEARPELRMEIDGKLKEPLLRLTQLYRAYDAQSDSGRYPLNFAYILFGQGPLQAPSVFNFFSPFYSPPGEIRNSSLVAPELQIATEYQNTQLTNYLLLQTFVYHWQIERIDNDDYNEDLVLINFEEELSVADDTAALVTMVDNKLMGGTMSDTLRQEISQMVDQWGLDQPLFRAANAIFLTISSPEFAYQR
ncbi:MAG: DUF1800 domain-containing protein [Woeseiaceae bacterium]|nr:DUF1800 domain-containing protein [Woeseiaceae bacterium]